MKLKLAIFFSTMVSALAPSGAWALSDGDLYFSIAGRNFHTSTAEAVIETKAGKKRILIAVKDRDQKFLFVFTAQLPRDEEARPQTLDSAHSDISVNLRTMQGSFALLPAVQLAKPTNLTYSEAVDVDTGELEDDPTDSRPHADKNAKRRKRRKIRREFKRVKPRWHTMSRRERIEQGEGVIENGAFKNAYFTLHLVPVVAGGKVTSYEGSFSGTGRYSRNTGTGEIVPITGGRFKVRVQYAD